MSKLLALVFSLIFISYASADCTQAYGDLISKKIKNGKITRVVGWSATGASGVVGGAAAYGSFTAVYGANIGIIFGLQAGVMVAIPALVGVVTVTQINKARIKSLTKAQHVLVAANGSQSNVDMAPLYEMFKKLKKDHVNLTMEDLKAEINLINDQQLFCNGQESRNLMGYRKMREFISERL